LLLAFGDRVKRRYFLYDVAVVRPRQALARLLPEVLIGAAALLAVSCSHGYSGPDCGSPLAAQYTQECNPNVRRGGG
jgi:hypothetical protein